MKWDIEQSIYSSPRFLETLSRSHISLCSQHLPLASNNSTESILSNPTNYGLLEDNTPGSDTDIIRSYAGVFPSNKILLLQGIFLSILESTLYGLFLCSIKTSPPSARVATMRFMLQQNFKTNTNWKILETPLKLFMNFSWNTLETFL